MKIVEWFIAQFKPESLAGFKTANPTYHRTLLEQGEAYGIGWEVHLVTFLNMGMYGVSIQIEGYPLHYKALYGTLTWHDLEGIKDNCITSKCEEATALQSRAVQQALKMCSISSSAKKKAASDKLLDTALKAQGVRDDDF